MAKFKVGDRVEVVSCDNADSYIGEVGTIQWRDSSLILIYFDNNSLNCNKNRLNGTFPKDFPDYFVAEENIQYARIRDSKLARKLYPNYKVVDEKWLDIN